MHVPTEYYNYEQFIKSLTIVKLYTKLMCLTSQFTRISRETKEQLGVCMEGSKTTCSWSICPINYFSMSVQMSQMCAWEP